MKNSFIRVALLFALLLFSDSALAETVSATETAAPASAEVAVQVASSAPALAGLPTGEAVPFKPDMAYLKDRDLLDKLQRDTFRYFWEHTYSESGLAYEDSRHKDVHAAIGGTGFGVAATVAAVERGWVSRADAVERITKIVYFLRDKTDRKALHGAFPHWVDCHTGQTVKFSDKDDGADLVETAFLMQGLLIAQAYFCEESDRERELRACIDELWRDVDWHWFTNGENNGLYWHWSPTHGFDMGMKITGFNEAMITYVLALASPTHPISREAARHWYSTHEYEPKSADGYTIEAANAHAGCMFLSHYSFIGLDPRRMADSRVTKGYMVRNITHALMNRAYCLDSAPEAHRFHEGFWGLTACNTKKGYTYQSAYAELGTVAPTAALASIPYVPEYSMRVLESIDREHREKLWGPYGPYDAFSLCEDWYDDTYIGIDQLIIPCMVENYRSGLLWSLFMNVPGIEEGLARMGIEALPASDGFPHVVVPMRKTAEGHVPDALDLRRHPDSGEYRIPFSSSRSGVAFFRLTDASGKVVQRFLREVAQGDHVLAFEQFMPASDEVFTLSMRIGDASAKLPVRFH